MDIGQAIFTLRKQRGLKLDAVASTVGTDTGYLSRIEQGARQPSMQMLVRIAKSLNCQVSEIFRLAEGNDQPGQQATPSEYDVDQVSGVISDTGDLRRALRGLPKEDRQLVIDFAKLLERRRGG